MEALSTVQKHDYSSQMLSLYGEAFMTETTSSNRIRRVPKRASKVESTTSGNLKWDNVVWLPSESATTLARLREFKTWKDGWDGEGSPAPNPVLVDTAISLHALLLNVRLTLKAHIGGDSLPIILVNHLGIKGEIIVEDKNEISFRFVGSGGEVFEDYCVQFNTLHLPESLTNIIDQIFGE